MDRPTWRAPTPVGYLAEMQARHVRGHVDDIRRIRQAHGVQAAG